MTSCRTLSCLTTMEALMLLLTMQRTMLSLAVMLAVRGSAMQRSLAAAARMATLMLQWTLTCQTAMMHRTVKYMLRRQDMAGAGAAVVVGAVTLAAAAAGAALALAGMAVGAGGAAHAVAAVAAMAVLTTALAGADLVRAKGGAEGLQAAVVPDLGSVLVAGTVECRRVRVVGAGAAGVSTHAAAVGDAAAVAALDTSSASSRGFKVNGVRKLASGMNPHWPRHRWTSVHELSRTWH